MLYSEALLRLHARLALRKLSQCIQLGRQDLTHSLFIIRAKVMLHHFWEDGEFFNPRQQLGVHYAHRYSRKPQT